MTGYALRSALALFAIAASFAVAAAAPAVNMADRDAAMRELQAPRGVGGCIFLAVPTAVRREALVSALARQPIPTEFQSEVAKATPRCSSRPYSSDNLALVGSVVAALRRSAAALALAMQFGVGQARLDQAWADASDAEKSAYYAVAEEFLTPGASVTHRTLDIAPLAIRSGLSPAIYEAAEPELSAYFRYTALSERSEAELGSEL